MKTTRRGLFAVIAGMFIPASSQAEEIPPPGDWNRITINDPSRTIHICGEDGGPCTVVVHGRLIKTHEPFVPGRN